MHTGEAGAHSKKLDASTVTVEAGMMPRELLVFSPYRKAKRLESAVHRCSSNGCSLRKQQGACEHVHAASLHLTTALQKCHP